MTHRKDDRAEAKEWAENVLKNFTIASADLPYVEAVLVQAQLMETPLKALFVGINDTGEHYKISIRGYRNLMNDVTWVNTFMGRNRDKMLEHVQASFTQLPPDGGCIKVIQMSKMRFLGADDDGGGGGGGEDNDRQLSVISSSSRSRRMKRHVG